MAKKKKKTTNKLSQRERNQLKRILAKVRKFPRKKKTTASGSGTTDQKAILAQLDSVNHAIVNIQQRMVSLSNVLGNPQNAAQFNLLSSQLAQQLNLQAQLQAKLTS